MIWIVFGALFVNGGLFLWSAIATIRLQRRLRHAIMLDKLLADIVIQAFTNRHLPIWTAWSVMGAIEVDIKQHRHMPGPDA